MMMIKKNLNDYNNNNNYSIYNDSKNNNRILRKITTVICKTKYMTFLEYLYQMKIKNGSVEQSTRRGIKRERCRALFIKI